MAKSFLYVWLPSREYPSIRFCYSDLPLKPNIRVKDVLAAVDVSTAATNSLVNAYLSVYHWRHNTNYVNRINEFIKKSLYEILDDEQLSQIDLLLVLSTGQTLDKWKLTW